MPRQLEWNAPDFEAAFAELISLKREASVDVNDVVAEIIADVRERGDAALFEYTQRFDNLTLDSESIRVRPEEILQAREACNSDDLKALETAAERIAAFHARQKPEDLR
ncbi:MAG: histidinol dehydrogenase, partial [Alphaproteobacteria bacterium]|nr:histidinol dehydrogenase [Alphaproteobacteria bacterium]